MFTKELERLVRMLFGPPKPTDGCSGADLKTVDKELPAPLLTVVRQFYLRFGENQQVMSSEMGFIWTWDALPSEIEDRHLSIWMANQGVASAGIPFDQLHLDDPPVELKCVSDADEVTWTPESRTTSGFLLRTVCENALWQMPARAEGEVPSERLADALKAVPLVAPADPLEGELRLYARDGLVVSARPFRGVFRLTVGASDYDSLDRFAAEAGLQLHGWRREADDTA